MKLEDAVFVVVDVETTGLDTGADRIVEIGAVATSLTRVLGMWSSLVDPGIPIPPEVSAIHGLTNADVDGAPSPSVACEALDAFEATMRDGGPDSCVLAAHNLEYDEAFLSAHWPSMRYHPRLCTKRLSQHLWPSYPAHRNQTLRFRRQLHVETYGISAHRALGDALVTAALLRDVLTCRELHDRGIADVAGAVDLSESPILHETWPFGKYRGQPIAAAPADYVTWCLRSMADLSRDMRYTLEQRLKAA